MARLIDADALEPSEIYMNYGFTRIVYMDDIDEMPTIEAEPIRHGKWIYVKGSNGKDYRKCSECLHTQEITGLLNYCPCCGARMDGE